MSSLFIHVFCESYGCCCLVLAAMIIGPVVVKVMLIKAIPTNH
jgi:hypothetical protein